MSMLRLTDAKLRAAKPREKEYSLFDGGGLICRVWPDGARYWAFRYIYNCKRKKMGLGRYPALALKDARARAAEFRAQLEHGVDPMESQRQGRESQSTASLHRATRPTVRELFEDFRTRRIASRKDGGATALRMFEKDVFPYIGTRVAAEIIRADIWAILDRVKERGVKRGLGALLGDIRQMFNYAASRDIVVGNPTFGISRVEIGGLSQPRERVLSPDEIRELAKKLPGSGLSVSTQTAIWIILSTICRVGEISQARWSDFDFKNRTWKIRAEISKNGREHLIHLSDFTLRQFKKLPRFTDCDWVYPGRHRVSHIETKSLQKMFRDRQREVPLDGRTEKTKTLKLSRGDWTTHDLRRTGASTMGELFVRPDVIDRCLNHIEEKVTRTYQRQDLMVERRKAFQLLGERLTELVRAEPAKMAEINASKRTKSSCRKKS